MFRVITTLGITLFTIALGAGSYFVARYYFELSEKASEPLTLHCTHCGMVVYTSRTGNRIRPFTASVQCTDCAPKRELKNIRRRKG